MNKDYEDTFVFGTEEDKASDNFNLDSISGLGESDYENPDLFAEDEKEVETTFNPMEEKQDEVKEDNNMDVFNSLPGTDTENEIPAYEYNDFKNLEESEPLAFDTETGEPIKPVESTEDVPTEEALDLDTQAEETQVNEIPIVETTEEVQPEEVQLEETETLEPIVEDTPVEESEETPEVDSTEEAVDDLVTMQPDQLPEIEDIKEEKPEKVEAPEISISDTPIEELNKLVEYNEESVESTDINGLFEKVNGNFKEASDIFRKNTEMKEKIDSRFNELKKLQSDIERTKKENIEEVDRYKEEVVEKLTEKKSEIEDRLNTLKELQATLEKDKAEFEEYKKSENDMLENTKKNIQTSYDERREELTHIEDILRKQKDSLDEERNQLSLDKIQYESDKNELANNLLKFNELVNSFTNGVNEVKPNE